MSRNAAKSRPQAAARPGEDATTDGAVLSQLAALHRMSVNELKAKWESLFGAAAPNNSREFLESRLAARIQELTYGGLSRETRRALDILADEIDGTIDRKRMTDDSRNPSPGTKLIREWDGAEHTVTVLGDGYAWEGRKYRSLSAVAKAITGTNWNGFRFFGLRDKQRSGK
jgi:hypothetical protein